MGRLTELPNEDKPGEEKTFVVRDGWAIFIQMNGSYIQLIIKSEHLLLRDNHTRWFQLLFSCKWSLNICQPAFYISVDIFSRKTLKLDAVLLSPPQFVPSFLFCCLCFIINEQGYHSIFKWVLNAAHHSLLLWAFLRLNIRNDSDCNYRCSHLEKPECKKLKFYSKLIYLRSLNCREVTV